ncbi:MAG: CMD domain protein [Pararhizobium sp.]
MTTPDIINHLTGIVSGSAIASVRARRPITRENAEKSYRALFAPVTIDDASLTERFAVATFVAHLHGDAQSAEHYGSTLAELENGHPLREAIAQIAADAATSGPYGDYPDGPLSAENKAGVIFRLSQAHREKLGERLASALEHAHLLVFRPRDASPQALKALVSAGWSTSGIVTLSQLVSFLAFQLRVVAGLKVLATS